jgi:hypothetical protein
VPSSLQVAHAAATASSPESPPNIIATALPLQAEDNAIEDLEIAQLLQVDDVILIARKKIRFHVNLSII